MDNQKFIQAAKELVKEKKISEDVVFGAMEVGLATAYKKNFDSKGNVRVVINRDTGEIKVFSFMTVVADDYEEIDDNVEITLSEAIKIIPNIEAGETIEEEVTPKEFGRVAISTCKQLVIQKIKEAEKESIMNEYLDKENELMVGLLSREDAKNYYIDLGRVHGVLPKTEIIPGEKLEMGSSIKVYVTKIENSSKGLFILLSRSHYGFVKRLLELEIPELNDGTIILYTVAREAGSRSKISVYSEYDNIDAVGSCIGEGGSRINRVIKELNGEKIDVIEYSKDPVEFIKNALSPAKNLEVIITDPKKQESVAIANDENLSLAIGKKGQNVKLAARLTHYKIDIKTYEEGITLGYIK